MHSASVTVLMSVFNGARFLPAAIESILCQTYRSFEFLIIDDGSTDNSADIIQSYNDRRIRFIRQSNIGLTASLNKGISLAKGDLIARQDADDFSEANRLETQVAYLEHHPIISMVGSYARYIDALSNEIGVWRPPCDEVDIKKEIIKHNTFCHGSVLFKKDCLVSIGNYREIFKYSQDYDCWLRFGNAFSFANIPQVLYNFRLQRESLSRRKFSDQLHFQLLAITDYQFSKIHSKSNLDGREINDLPNFLKKRYCLSTYDINRFKSKQILNFSTYEFSRKNFSLGLKYWLLSMRYHPKPWKLRHLYFILKNRVFN